MAREWSPSLISIDSTREKAGGVSLPPVAPSLKTSMPGLDYNEREEVPTGQAGCTNVDSNISRLSNNNNIRGDEHSELAKSRWKDWSRRASP